MVRCSASQAKWLRSFGAVIHSQYPASPSADSLTLSVPSSMLYILSLYISVLHIFLWSLYTSSHCCHSEKKRFAAHLTQHSTRLNTWCKSSQWEHSCYLFLTRCLLTLIIILIMNQQLTASF